MMGSEVVNVRKYRLIFLFGFITLLLIGTLVGRNFYQSKHALTCSSYTIQTLKLQNAIRIAHLTDLHNSEFGEKNQNLIDLVAEQSPDLILITGDLLNSDEPQTDIATDLIKKLSGIASVYISLGNHELEYEENYGTDIVHTYEEAGAMVMDRQYEDITVKGQQIRLGGIYGYCLPEKYLGSGEADEEECAFLSDFQDTDLYTILMCHMPVSWLLSEGLDEWDVDCVFSGHVHGGQVSLPFIGSVYGPDFGWFPGKLWGVYDSAEGNKKLILSKGLGNTEWIPRWNNIPEVVVTDILPQ